MKLLFTSFLLVFILGTNASAQWKQSTGYGSDQMLGFFGYPPYLLVSVSSSTFGGSPPTIDSLLGSTDNGQTWSAFAPNGGSPLTGVVDGSIPTIIGSATFPSGGGSFTGMLAYSNDFANQFKTWLTDTVGYPTAQPTNDPNASSLVTMGSTIYAADGAYGVYQQTAPGAKWTPDTVGMTAGATPYSVSTLIVSGTDIFASTIGGGIMISTNQGASWTPINNGLTSAQPGVWLGPAGSVFALSGTSLFAMIPNNNFGFDTLYNIYRTTNNGQSWTQMNPTPIKGGVGVATIFTASSQSLFIASNNGVNASNDNGKTWFQANQGLPDFAPTYSNITTFQVSGGNLVIGILGLNQIWYRSLSEFAPSSVGASGSGASLTLSESFPNPVNNTSKINYSLISNSMASLTLFDITGKQIAVLANGYQIAGDHSAAFDGSALPSGMYFYRLTTAEGSIGQWLQLIK